MAVLAPSILSADFARLGADVKEAEAGGAGAIHVDAMDGHFVPNLTIGPAVAAAVRKVTQLPVDCHLMVQDPDRLVDAFAEAGADMISVHVEAATHLHRTVTRIREAGAQPGVAINPATPLSALEDILPEVGFVVVMSVNPGFGGQRLIPACLEKTRRLRERIVRDGLDCRIEIDGGITEANAAEAVAAGADLVVSGSAVFGADDIRATTRRMVRAIAEKVDA